MLQNQINQLVRDVPNFPKEGILFKDITPLFLHPDVCKGIVENMAENALRLEKKVSAVAGIESRGFLFGMLLAQTLQVPFHLIRKKGKLPGETVEFTYNLEYGTATVEIHKGFVQPADNVLIHDDVLATGGTATAAAELIRMEGGNVAGFTFLMELDFLKGRQIIAPYSPNIYSIMKY